MMNHPSHHPPPHPSSGGGGYPPPPPMYGGGHLGGPPGPPNNSHGMPSGPSGSHHGMHPSQGPPPPPPPSHGHHGGHHLGRGPPPLPGQTNGIPPPGGPSPRIMSGAPVPPPQPHPADGPSSMPPPPPRTASAASQHHMQHPSGPVPYDVGPTGISGQSANMAQKLAHSNEQAWIAIGSASEAMEDYERAIAAYDSALRHNPFSIPAMNAIAGVHRTMDRFEKAVDYFQRVLNIVPENGETWGAMGHCYLMMDDLQKAYTAYQQALYHLPNPKEPKLWYGIGILYDRYGSLEHAEEAFASVVRMDPNYEKANEIYFRLGIIYKQQNKFGSSLECFRYILNNPPRPLTEIDIWFQIGHVYEQQKEFAAAKDAYERVLAENPAHAKVLQQLGWLYHQSNAGFENQDMAIQFLTKSLESDANDAQSWYLLGRAYMAERNYNKAYEAYQQAVYRDGKNPTFWCSIGVLYYQISQYRDALDAYSRAIRLNPYISEVWFDLGSLYESCNNQISDAIDAYARAAELDPENPHIQQRLTLLRNAEARGEQVSSAPVPQDIHPTAYANHPGNAGGPPAPYGAHLGGESGSRDLGHGSHGPPGPARRSQSPGPGGYGFHDGPPPSIPNIDDGGAHRSSQHALAPMEAPRPGQTPPPQYGAGSQPQGRTSPRSQAYSSRNAEYERERMRESEMAWERGSHAHGPSGGPSNGPYGGHPGEYGPPGGGYNNGRGHGPHYEMGGPPPMQQPYGQYNPSAEQSRAPPGNAKGGPTSKGNGSTAAARKKAGLKNDSKASSPQVGNRSAASARSPAGNQGKKAGKGDLSRASPASDSSSGSNRPLAAGSSNTDQAPAQRLVDEDYDGNAADALMGLAGAASASAPLSHESSKAAPAETVPPSVNTSKPEERFQVNGAESELTQAEKFDDIKKRAEAAADAEDLAEKQGGAIQGLGKRSAEDDGREEGLPEKRARNEDESKAPEEQKDDAEMREVNPEPISTASKIDGEQPETAVDAKVSDAPHVPQPNAEKESENLEASASSALSAANELTSALDKAATVEGETQEKAQESQTEKDKDTAEMEKAPVNAVEPQKEQEPSSKPDETELNGRVSQPIGGEKDVAIVTDGAETKVEDTKPPNSEEKKDIAANDPPAEAERPASRAQSELEEGEVA